LALNLELINQFCNSFFTSKTAMLSILNNFFGLTVLGLFVFGQSPNAQTTSTDSTVMRIPAALVPTVDSALVRPRLAALQSSVPLNYNKYVHGFIDFFAYRKPSFTKSMLEKRSAYFPIFEKYLKEYSIPDEIKYLSIIESALNPKAVSYAGAVGLWQFMPKTGKIDFGLQIDKYIDERQHITRSTIAACKYMRQLYRIFGDWELVLAAYNTGPGNVRRALRKAGGGGFWQIYPYLHPQTRSYVPQYVAIVYMMNHAADHNIYPEKNEVLPQGAPVLVNNYLNLKTLSALGNFPYELLQQLNPQILKAELPENTKDFLLNIPVENYTYFDANKATILDSASKRMGKIIIKPTLDTTIVALNDGSTEAEQLESPEELEKIIKKRPQIKYHTVRRGENLTQIAQKNKVNVYDLKAWNNLRRMNSLKYGQKLKLYEEEILVAKKAKYKKVKEIEEPIVAEEVVLYEPKAKRKESSQSKTADLPEPAERNISETIHSVKRGETLYKIALKHGVSMGDLREWNKIPVSGTVKVGQKLKLFGLGKTSETTDETIAANTKKTKQKRTEAKEMPKYHKVSHGDTIWSIAQKYDGLTVDKLKKLNGIKNDQIKQGQKLKIS
jgi:membrane-bound lytic murein transglycosylase D